MQTPATDPDPFRHAPLTLAFGHAQAKTCGVPRRPSRPAVLLAALLAWSCGDTEPPALAVGPASYTTEQLLGLSQERRELLATIVGVGLAVADSSEAVLGAPLVAWSENESLIDLLKAAVRVEQEGIDEEELEARYRADPEWELTVRHILFLSERFRPLEQRRQAEAKADRALRQLREGADFAETAALLSEEPGAEGRQGLLTPGRRGSWVNEFWEAAVALHPGEVGEVIETEYGFHILRLEDRRALPFEEGRTRLIGELAEELGGWETALNLQDGLDTAFALEEVRARGLVLSPVVSERLSLEWVARVAYWAEELGFRRGMSSSAVAAAALRALGDSAPGPTLVRDELALPIYRHLVEQRYEVAIVPASSAR